MNRSLVARFILQFQDRTSAGLSALQRRLQGLQRMTGRFALLTGAVAGLSFLGPVQGAAALETRLRDVSVTAGVTGAAISANVDRLRGELNALATEYRLSTGGILQAAEVLTARGLDPEQVRAYTRMIALVASASGAAETDLAQLAVAFERIARVTGETDQTTAMAQAMRAGQLGGAELRDMARYLPGVLAQMQSLQVTGPRAVQNAASMFQVIRDGFGTTEEAAAGLQQMIGHLFSESTQKNARDLGLDLPAIYRDAIAQAQRGVDIDPIEAMMQRIRGALSGRPEAIFELFPDQNSRQAFQAVMAQMSRYLDIRNELRRTGPAVLTQASADRTTGLGAEMREFTERVSQFNDRIGRAFGFNLGFINGALSEFLKWIQGIDATSPGAVDQVLKFAAGAVLLASGLGALGFVLGPIAAGVAALASPFGLAVVAAAAFGVAAWQIYKNWDGIAAWFQDLWTRMRPQVDWLVDVGSGAVALLMSAWAPVSTFFVGLWEGVKSAAASAGEGIMRGVSAVAEFLRPAWEGSPLQIFFTSVRSSIDGLLGLIERLQTAWNTWTGSLARGDAAAANAAGPAAGSVQQRMGAAAANRTGGFYSPAELAGAVGGGAANGNQRVGGEITVRALPGTEIVDTTTANDRVPITADQNRGATRARP